MVQAVWLFLLVTNLLVHETFSHYLLLREPSDLNNSLCGSNDGSVLPAGAQLLLSTDVHHILSSTSFCLVSNTSNITLRSVSSIIPATITCESYQNNSFASVGFGFYNVSVLSIENVLITKCGGLMPSTSTLYPNDTSFYFHESQSVTLLISYSSDIMLSNVNINNYYGFAVLLINPNNNSILNNVNITFSFGNVQCSENFSLSCGGSGLILYFSNLDNRTKVLRAHVLLNTSYIKGIDNIVPYDDISNAGKVHTEEPKAISAFSAGMTVIFSQGDYSANVVLSNTYWQYTFGGLFSGMAFIFNDAPIGKATITMKNSTLNHNVFYGRDYGSIGCMVTTTKRFASSFKSSLDLNWTILTVTDSEITDHYNYFSTSDFYYRYRPTLSLYNHSFFHIITSSDVLNKLRIHLSYFNYSQKYIGMRNPFILSETINGHKNLEFILHSIEIRSLFKDNSLETAVNSGKLVFVNTKSVYINGENNYFINITGSIIQAYNSDIHLNGTLLFYNNKASHGAAIGLDSLSHLFIHESTNATFINNSAFFFGGAIYSHMSRNLPMTNPLCTIQVVSKNISQLKAKMSFKENNAKLAGNSIYISPLYDCQQLYLKKVNLRELYMKLFHFQGNKTYLEISSVAVSAYNCSINNNTSNDNEIIQVYPGQTITVGLRAYDINGNPTYAEILTRLSKKIPKFDSHKTLSSVDIKNHLPIEQRIQTVYSNSCTLLNFTIFPESTNDKSMYLYFEVAGYIPTTPVKLVQQSCPPGFVYNKSKKACDCSSFLKSFDIIHCDIDTTSVHIPPKSWLGILDNEYTVGYTEHCPPGYCQPNTIINITQDDIMCKGNRMGWLCGQCKINYSVVLGSSDCYKCSNTLHIVLTLIFGILGGIVYVLVLFCLRLTIDLGTLGGFIFWLNIIWPYVIPSDMTFNNRVLKYMVNILTSIKYQWNIPVCITNNFNELGKTAVLYFFPFYLWFIVAVIVLLSRYSTRIANLIFGSSVQVLVTLMYISYSDLLSISLVVLTPAHLHFNNTNNTGKLLVWFKDGTVLYGQNPYHIVLLCVSIAVLSLFIVPFTLIGLFGVKMLRSRFIAKYVRPFIDAIHGPYKEKLRYWFGVRLVVLSLMYIITVVLQGSNLTLQLLLFVLILNVFIITQAVVLPYKNKILNGLDLWFMVLLLVNFTTSHSYSLSENTRANNIMTSVEIILCSITYLVILMYHMYISMSHFQCIRKCIQHCQLIKVVKNKYKRMRHSRVSASGPLLRYDDPFQYKEWESED